MNNVPYIKLKELCDVNQGLQIPISKRFTEDGENRYFYITVQFLKDSHLEKYYVEKPPKSSICNQDDIIVVRTGSTGQVLTGINGCFHNNFFKINHDKEKVLGKYLYYCLSSKEKQAEMKRRAGITTIPDLNHFMFLDMKIPLPKYSTQLAVVKILDELNSQIELNNKINSKLKAMAKLIYDYWFVQFDFPDVNGKPYKTSGGKMVYNEALKREIPEGWENGKLHNIIKLNYGKPLKKGDRSGIGYPVVGSGGVVGFHDDYLVKGPGIVVGRKGSVGSLTYLDDNFYPIDTSYFVENKLDIGISYVLHLLKTLRLNTMNSDSAVPGLNRDRALDVDVVLAPIELITSFCNISKSMFNGMANNRMQNKKLVELRDWLLPMLMNGQVTIKSPQPNKP